VEGEAADDQEVLLLRLHGDGAVVVQLKDLPVGETTALSVECEISLCFTIGYSEY